MTITTAHSGDRTMKLAPLARPYCERGLHAHDIEIIGYGIRIVRAIGSSRPRSSSAFREVGQARSDLNRCEACCGR